MHYEIMLEVDKTIVYSCAGTKRISISRFDPKLDRPYSADYNYDSIVAAENNTFGRLVTANRYRDGGRTLDGLEKRPTSSAIKDDERLIEVYDEIFKLLPLFKNMRNISREASKDVFIIDNDKLSPAVRDKIESIFHHYGFSKYEDVKHLAGYRPRF